MATEIMVALITVAGVLGTGLGGVLGSWVTAQYTSSVRVAILEHERACKNIPPLLEQFRDHAEKMDMLSNRINDLLQALPKRRADM